MPTPSGPAIPPRVPDVADAERHRAAHDRLALVAAALVRGGFLVLDAAGNYVLSQTIKDVLGGSLDDLDGRLDELEEFDVLEWVTDLFRYTLQRVKFLERVHKIEYAPGDIVVPAAVTMIDGWEEVI